MRVAKGFNRDNDTDGETWVFYDAVPDIEDDDHHEWNEDCTEDQMEDNEEGGLDLLFGSDQGTMIDEQLSSHTHLEHAENARLEAFQRDYKVKRVSKTINFQGLYQKHMAC